jgi:hypothetical protein
MQIREISTKEREQLAEYLSLDENVLYSLLPPYLAEYKQTYFTFKGQIDAGKKAFAKIRDDLHVKICEEWKLCDKIDDPMLQDQVNLAIVIADTIMTIKTGIPPFIISTILVKIGLRDFCNCPRKKG